IGRFRQILVAGGGPAQKMNLGDWLPLLGQGQAGKQRCAQKTDSFPQHEPIPPLGRTGGQFASRHSPRPLPDVSCHSAPESGVEWNADPTVAGNRDVSAARRAPVEIDTGMSVIQDIIHFRVPGEPPRSSASFCPAPARTASADGKNACMKITAAGLRYETLKNYGVDCIVGMEDPTHFLHAVARSVTRIITIHDEKRGAIMAHGYAQVSGRPGICAATYGPGAANLATGLYEAQRSSVPVIAIVQDHPLRLRNRHANSEL